MIITPDRFKEIAASGAERGLEPDAIKNELLRRGHTFDEAPTWTASNTSTGPIADSGAYRTYLGDLQGSIDRMMQRSKDLNALYDQRDLALDQRQAGTEAGIEARYEKKTRAKQEAQASDRATLSNNLARIGGYLGGSASEIGVMGNLQSKQSQELADLESEKEGLILEAKNLYEDKKFAQAEARIKEANALEQAIYEREKDAKAEARLAKEDERKAQDDAIKKATRMAYNTYQQLTDDEGANAAIIESAARKAGIDPEEFVGILREVEIAQKKAENDSYGSGIIGEYNFARANGYTGTFSEYQQEDANRKMSQDRYVLGTDAYGNPIILNTRTGEISSSEGGDPSGGSPMNQIPIKLRPQVDKITGAWDNETVIKNYNLAAEAKLFVDSLDPNTVNPQDDQGLIYAFAKAMDPTSVVREGEYATVQKYAQTWAQQFGVSLKRFMTNAPFLSKKARENIKATIQSKYGAIEKMYNNTYEEYGRRIDQITGREDGTSFLTDYRKAVTDDAKTETLDEYYQANPGMQKKIDDFQRQNPNLSDEDVLRIFTGDENKKVSYTPERFLAPGSGLASSQMTAEALPKQALAIASAPYRPGTRGGQCGDFAHKIVDFPSVGDGKKQKFATVDRIGIKAAQWRKSPRIGDVIITGENPTYGHVAIIQELLPGNRARLLESNFHQDGKVTNHRIINLASNKIYGAIRGRIKVPNNNNYSGYNLG